MLFFGWFAIVVVFCVLTQRFLLVLGCFVNVVVIVCLSKVLCWFWVYLPCCCLWLMEQGVSLVACCFVLFSVAVFVCLSKVLYKFVVDFTCGWDCLFKQGVVLVVG